MLSIDCSSCKNHCCGKVKELRPIMMPWEEDTFKEFCDIIKKPSHEMLVLKRKSDGNCIFLDDKAVKCKIYDRRPFECMIYPLLLKFPDKKPTVVVDRRFCKNLGSLEFDEKKVLFELKKHKFPKDWIDGFKDMVGF
jgi:Fe-S-cluster containining protein